MNLNLPPAELLIKKQNGKDYVFDRLRKQYIRLTPEEFVRQQFVSFLIEHKGYPPGRMANETGIVLGNVRKRCDTVLYDNYLQPLMIMEYKSPDIEINQHTFDQIARYNLALQAPWMIISNGMQHFCCHLEKIKQTYVFINAIPDYETIAYPKSMRLESSDKIDL